MSALEARQAIVRRGGQTILGPASIEIGSGEMTALIGPNGSGKSTLLRLFAGLWRPDEGEALLDGQTIHSRPRKEIARRIAFVPQDTQIDFAFTVSEILAMGRYAHRGRFAPQSQADHAAIDSAATYCDITHLLDRAINTLSGGERQRVLIARSLVAEAEFILLDEPTANLDVQHALDILELCKTLSHKGKTIIVATHDFNLVTRYATCLILLQAGKLIAQGSRETVLSREAIQEVFQVDAEVVPTKAGPPVYVFHQRSAPRPERISPRPFP
jgi:iron complex transport system ATP-binding protein